MAAYNTVVKKDDTVLIVSPSSSKILNRLKGAGEVGLTYSELKQSTRIPRNSLYVFSQRLRKSKLVNTRVDEKGDVRLVLKDHELIALYKARNIG